MSDKEKGESVQVVVRCRPLNSTERGDGNEDIVTVDQGSHRITVRDTRPNTVGGSKDFTYDGVFPQGSSQESVYVVAVSQIVDFVLQGYNGTVFAYGQTGTGKTHTMEGSFTDEVERGVIPRTFEHIFSHIATEQAKNPANQFLVSCQCVEIYQEEVMDLLRETVKGRERPKLQLKAAPDGGFVVAGAAKHVVKSAADCQRYLVMSKSHRAVGATKMNPGSSRSHCIFTLTVETSMVREDGEQHIRLGKLNLVDLAGSERQAKTQATGARLKEGILINLSLMCLGQVISALTSRSATHIPYRDSQLTRLLMDSLGGNTKTVMIANVGPADYNVDETVETLRFASRAKLIKNKPRVNEDPKDGLLREYQDEIKRLRAALEATEAIEGGGDVDAILQQRGLSLGGGGGAAQEVLKITEKVEVTGVAKEELDQVEQESLKKREDLLARHQEEARALQALQEQLQSKAAATEAELAERARLLQQQQRTKRELADQLRLAEEKLQMDRETAAQAVRDGEALERRKLEILEHERLTEEKRLAVKAKDEEYAAALQRSNKASEMVQILQRKLEKLRDDYGAAKQQVADATQYVQRERKDLYDHVQELKRHLEFQLLLVKHFIPPEQGAMMRARAVWDEQQLTYSPQGFDFRKAAKELQRPGSLHESAPRPVTNFERRQRAAGAPGLRFAARNILELGLDASERTTQDIQDVRDAAATGFSIGNDHHGMGGGYLKSERDDDYAAHNARAHNF
jgi:kinesin family protein 3/17